MTFDQYEISKEDSQPLELFEFAIGSQTYRYTNAEDEVEVDLLTYTPEAIKRSRVEKGAEAGRLSIEIELPARNEFAERYIGIIPGQKATLVVKRVQRLDFPSPEVFRLFDGIVKSVSFEDDGNKARVQALPRVALLSRPIPRRRFQAGCNNVLYGSGCNVDDTDPAYRHTGEVTAVSGRTITVDGASGFAAEWWVAGRVERSGGADARLILAHSGDDLTLLLPFPDDVTGETVTLLAGCPHGIVSCDDKFDNIVNATSGGFDGYAFVPKKNIFATGLD